MNFTEDIKQHRRVLTRGCHIHQLMSPKLCHELNCRILSYWSQQCLTAPKTATAFPGPQPASLEKIDFVKLQRKEYLVCAKCDGERYFLYLTRVNGICLSLMVNRKFEWFIIDQNFEEECYVKETLLDGEFMGRVFILHDTFVSTGVNVIPCDFPTRYNAGMELLKKYRKYSTTPANTFDITYKTFYPLKNIHIVFEEMRKSPETIDGIIFIPLRSPVGMGTQMDLYKWKAHHTIDFVVKLALDKTKVDLYEGFHGKERLHQTLNIDVFMKAKIDTLCLHKNPFVVVEFTVENNEYIPLKIRNDKPRGNSHYTIKKTLFNIRENIQEKDFKVFAAQAA